MKEIDCRGMACPQPVVTAKKALDESDEKEFTLIVDNLAARDNVERFAQSQGAAVDVGKKGNDYYLHIQKGGT
ncbi:MAG TPA: sulfurtransferase TusA family protein, partial [Thermodesulfobacteriota bacterium]|nr:sulfurtransferase TusA family protein [Thermodesulfobacteriota bacterium]